MARSLSCALRIGSRSGFAVAALGVAYAAVLAIGLAMLPSPDHPIPDPWFTAMELLILFIAPSMVGLAVGLHGWVDAQRKPLATLALVFLALCTAVTCCVHFAILTLGRHPAFADERWQSLVFSFRWPSVAYALDILAWDVFFALGALFAAFAVHGPGLARFARLLLFGSAALAFAGLAGVAMADMNVRNLGIVGYAILFPIAAALLGALFRQRRPRPA